jgi:hypothetical protein
LTGSPSGYFPSNGWADGAESTIVIRASEFKDSKAADYQQGKEHGQFPRRKALILVRWNNRVGQIAAIGTEMIETLLAVRPGKVHATVSASKDGHRGISAGG